MKYETSTDGEEKGPIRLDAQGIPILQEVVVSEAETVAGPDSNARQTSLPLTPEQPEQVQVEALRQVLEARFQQMIEEQVEQLSRQFREQLTSALRQTLEETLQQLSSDDGPEEGDRLADGDGPAA